ncbi:MAG: hypothetical protein IJ503_02525 [Akkermansia sp.]|nr:hypothetical protein [Akkermansia sp.]
MKNYKAEKGNRTEWWSWMTLCFILLSFSLSSFFPYLILTIPIVYGIASARRIGHIGLSRLWVFAWLPIVVLFPLFLAILQVPNTVNTLLWLVFFIIIPGCIAGDDKNA